VTDPESLGTVVIGVGNRDRGDDGAGPVVIDQLRAAGVTVLENGGDGAALIESWEGFTRVIIVDAMASGAAPGTIRRFDAAHEPLPKGAFGVASTHLFGIVEGLEMARTLGRLPTTVIVYGIEGGSFTLGTGLSGRVEQACRQVAQDILKESFQPQKA